MINAEIVAPNSIYINGDENLSNFYESLNNGIFIKGSQLKDDYIQTKILLSDISNREEDILEKDDKKKYKKLLKEMRELYDLENNEPKIPKYVRPFEKIINNSMDCEIRIMIIVFTAVKKFKRLINKNQSENEDQKVGVIDPLIDYYSKRVNYSSEDNLRHYAENRANHIQRMKKLSFLEGKHQIYQFEGIIYEGNMMVKNELQVHNRPEIQNEYYIFISKRLINRLLMISNSIIKQKRKEMNQEEADEILKIMEEICDLHVFQFKTKTSISKFVMQDMIKIVDNMKKMGFM